MRVSFGLLRMRLSRSIIRCSSKVFSRQATGSWPGGTSAFDSCSVTASLACHGGLSVLHHTLRSNGVARSLDGLSAFFGLG